MIAPHDIWLDASLRVTTDTDKRYMLAKRKGDRMSQDDCERFGVGFVAFDMNARIEPAQIRPADAGNIRTANIEGPRTSTSPGNGAPSNASPSRKRRHR